MGQARVISYVIQACRLQWFPDLLQPLIMFTRGAAVDDDVIHVNGHSLQPFQCLYHFPLEDLRIFQNPDAASRDEKTVEPLNCTIISSDVGKMNLSLLTALLSFFKSTQMSAFPDLFWTGIIGALHSLWSVTASMMSLASICSNSSFTAPRRGIRTLRAVHTV